MTPPSEVREVEELLARWNALRVTEIYRRTNFASQRDAAMARWASLEPHTPADEHFIDFRVSRGVTALAELMEFEDRTTRAYEECRVDLERAATLEGKDRAKRLTRLRDVAQRAIRQDMRHLATLTSTYQYELDELVDFIDERESDARG